MTTKAAALRTLIESKELEFLLEAHNALSARIAEEAGFGGIWASGLSMSAQFGVRDSNEASWTQVVDHLEFMSDATAVPILLDGDTGYGNFNSVRRLVRKLEQRGVAGVCLEDKLFPKTNSFIAGERQPLADIEEFRGKIAAAKDSQVDPDFCVVARVEALIAGWGLDAALERAEAYREAGADAILIHSKRSQADEILAFAAAWRRRAPLVIVPTKYYGTPTEVFRKAGIDLVIWANHLLRASVAAMQGAAARIARDQGVAALEDSVATVAEIFRLQGDDELRDAERRYVPTAAGTSALVLAATRGRGLESVTEDRPKVMIPVAGRPLLRRLVDELKRNAVHDVTVVGGYRAEAIDVEGVKVVRNEAWAESGELASLAAGIDSLGDDAVVLYGDLLFRRYILRDLLDAPGEIVAVVDSATLGADADSRRDLAYCSAADDRALFRQQVRLQRVALREEAGAGEPQGRWMGMLGVRGEGAQRLREALRRLGDRADFASLGMTDLLNELANESAGVQVVYVHGHWLDVNDLDDLARASEFAHGGDAA